MLLASGQPIPDKTLPDQSGEARSLRALAGAKGTVFYFYPKDNTPGCTVEAQEFELMGPEFRAKGYEVVGISKDSTKSNTSFCQKYGLNFTLLSDKDGDVCESFGVWQEKIRCGKTSLGIVRSTFVANAEGILVKVYPNVSAKGHAAQVLKDLDA